ncbi:MAG: amidophosphoribosyltransferase, partial [Clostridia bacterium]|nr:amidophosphoribosyltransferase [Clostridia bacterium]
IRVGCPPLMYSCKYLNFSRSTSEMELITRRVITRLEGKEPDAELLRLYCDPESEQYNNMVEEIRKELHFTTLRYHRLDDMIEATGLPEEKLCTYCWSGKE